MGVHVFNIAVYGGKMVRVPLNLLSSVVCKRKHFSSCTDLLFSYL